MKYPEVLLLPLLMFADYFLTVLGAVKREEKHALHYKIENYELNPMWQKAIRQRKWFNPRHAFLAIATSAGLTCLIEWGDMPDWFNQVLVGTCLVLYCMLVARHLNNLLLFRYLAKHPEQISGEIKISHQLALSMSLFHTMVAMIPMGAIAIFPGNNLARGGLLGNVLLFCIHLKWIRKAKRQSPVVISEPSICGPDPDRPVRPS